MTFLSILTTWTMLFPAGLHTHPKGTCTAYYQLVGSQLTTVDSIQARRTVTTFLNWYRMHMKAVNRAPLVNQRVGKPYSVNLKNGERYLANLQSSHLLTTTYLNQWRVFFKERNEGFRLSPQYEGPPTGFEYDLVMLTQDVDKQLASLTSLKIDNVVIIKNRATVELTLFDAYEFRLVRHANHWMINEILNMSQE